MFPTSYIGVAVILTALTLSQVAKAERQPPLAFDEEITVLSGAIVNVNLQAFEPSTELVQRVFSIFDGPDDLAFLGSSASAQSCAFRGVCAFFTGNFVGQSELRFRVTTRENDESTGATSLPGIVLINVVESIDTPIAFPQTARTVEGATVAILPNGIGPQETGVSFEIVTPPSSGTLSAMAGSVSNAPEDAITYTPATGFAGEDQFVFTVSDGVTVSDPQTVQIVVQAIDAPVITDTAPVSGSVNGGQLVTLSGINFVADATEVRFGSSAATEVTVVSPQALSVVTPAHPVGVVDVAVITASGESVFRDGYTFAAADRRVVAAVLPVSRSVQVGVDATALASIINAGNEALTNCRIEPGTAVDATFSFQTTDPTNNAVVGTPDVGVDLLPGAVQSFVFRLTPTAPIAPTTVSLNFSCDDDVTAPMFEGVNTLQLSSSSTPIPDVIALNAVNNFPPLPAGTVGVDVGGSTFFAVAVANVGASDTIEAEVSASDPGLPLSVSICREPAECMAGSASSLLATLDADQTDSFFILVQADGDIPFQPESSRLVVEFRDSTGVVRGSTSVAVANQ